MRYQPIVGHLRREFDRGAQQRGTSVSAEIARRAQEFRSKGHRLWPADITVSPCSRCGGSGKSDYRVPVIPTFSFMPGDEDVGLVPAASFYVIDCGTCYGAGYLEQMPEKHEVKR